MFNTASPEACVTLLSFAEETLEPLVTATPPSCAVPEPIFNTASPEACVTLLLWPLKADAEIRVPPSCAAPDPMFKTASPEAWVKSSILADDTFDLFTTAIPPSCALPAPMFSTALPEDWVTVLASPLNDEPRIF